ncbi:PREDICTED: U6 snRNA-associated Sm-like protein LSm1 [Eurypyga helias]|uniref:U6 snRNA-associated Sm-like protein LSm1 n=1 Tax=Eurypyga helias TaxID=54383 RepID=UPI0005293E10|nr:PREDICTED: U6 snRNA-associated Sm-like protein LSm1 [Eurypyga helias]
MTGEKLLAEVRLPRSIPRAELRVPAVTAPRPVLNGLFPLQDLEKESDTPLQQVSIEEILEEQRVEQQAKQESEKLKVQALKKRGLCVPRADTLDEY